MVSKRRTARPSQRMMTPQEYNGVKEGCHWSCKFQQAAEAVEMFSVVSAAITHWKALNPSSSTLPHPLRGIYPPQGSLIERTAHTAQFARKKRLYNPKEKNLSGMIQILLNNKKKTDGITSQYPFRTDKQSSSHWRYFRNVTFSCLLSQQLLVAGG